MENTQKRKLTGAAFIVMSSIVVSRITGFIREMLIPNRFEDKVADAYNAAFLVPDLMYNLLVGGAVAAALIPVLTGYISKNREKEGWKAVGTFINISIFAMVVFSILGMIYAPQLIKIIAPVWGEDTPVEFALTVKLTRILFPSVSFLMLAGLCNGVLNSYHRFAASAYGPTIYNIGSGLSILLLSNSRIEENFGVETVAYGVMISSLIYFLVQFSFAFKHFLNYKPKLFIRHSGFGRLFRLAIPSLLSSSVAQINLIISARFTNYFAAGSLTALKIADRTWQLPLGIFAQGIGVAILPSMSASFATNDIRGFKSLLSKALNTVLLLAIPSAVGFIVLKEHIIRTAFKFTSFMDEGDVKTASMMLMLYSIALLAQSIVAIILRAFYAYNDTKTPLYIGSFTIVLNFAFNKIFIETTNLGAMGMPLSYSIATSFNAIMLLLILNKKAKGIHLDKLFVFLIKTIPAALIMGGVIYGVDSFLPTYFNSKIMQVVQLALLISFGAITYFSITLILKVNEARYIFDTVMGKLNAIKRKVVK